MNSDSDTKHSRYQLIWQVVRGIPFGQVASYGQVARAAGLARQARLVGYALHHLPAHSDVPWHRVVNAKGKLSFPPHSEQYALQQDLLRAEGIVFIQQTIDLKQFGWQIPSHLDTALF